MKEALVPISAVLLLATLYSCSAILDGRPGVGFPGDGGFGGFPNRGGDPNSFSLVKVLQCAVDGGGRLQVDLQPGKSDDTWKPQTSGYENHTTVPYREGVPPVQSQKCKLV